MKKQPVDPVVLEAGEWLQKELEHTDAEGIADATVIVYRMVSKFPMTAAQYWQIANAGRAVMPPSAYLDPWMSAQVWMALSDWDGSGDGLHRLDEAAAAFWTKDLEPSANPEYMMSTLRKGMITMSTRVTWTAAAFKKWLANHEHELAQWTAKSVMALSTDTHADLLNAYLHRGGEHTNFELEAVRLLLESKRWRAGSITAYMARKSRSMLCQQTLLVIGAWLDTLKWTPGNTKNNVAKLCSFLRDEPLQVWENFLPSIGSGLTYLDDNPLEVEKIVTTLTNAPYTKIGQPKLMALVLASINAALPERFVIEAIQTSGLLYVLENKNYPVQQRLGWLKTYEDYAMSAGNVMAHMGRMAPPLKDALALLCFLSANKRDTPAPVWRAAGLVESNVSKRDFLEVNAPSLLEKIDLVLALDLSYADAVDMVIDAGDEKLQASMLSLPELSDAVAPEG